SRYRPAIGLLRLCGPALASFDLRRLARPILEALAEQTGESVNLMVPDGNYGLYVDSVESRQNIRMVVRIGAQEHLHRSAVGKAILAHLPDAKRDAVLDAAGLARATEKTIVDRDALLTQLAEVRARGWALDDEEGEAGTRCCGAPIFDGEGKVLGALSVAGPAFRLPLERLAALAPAVKVAATRVSACFGHRG
ncbi:MAG TPA: IclR family transcriptional regulator, partial [Limnochordia bacterium]|nr:IclR family transcriptional regulator [Limnochordia bacterium]